MTTPIDDSPSQLSRILYDHWVGRARELDEANTLWQRAASGQGQVLLISGEPGVGKTRFVRELASAASLSGANVLTGECYAEGGAPYGPLAQIIRDAFENASPDILNFPGETLRNLLPIIPSLHLPLIDSLPDQKFDPSVEQQRAYEGFLAFCTTLTSLGPLFLFIDDVHWADTATLLLLRSLARRGRKLPLLIVMTYRDSELESAPDLNRVLIDLNRERLALHLKLERLSREETHDLLAAMFGEKITPDFLDGIFLQTEGNPFFIEEVCKGLIEASQISFQDGRWHRPDMAEMKIPQTVHSAIQARLQKLPTHAQEVLLMGAILGSDFDFETLKHACDLDEETLVSVLEKAEHAQLIAEAQPCQAAVLRFNFVHGLIPTTMREGMIHIRRRRLHLRAAQAIEAVHPEEFEVLAYQYTEAGEAQRALQFYVRAGDRARWAAPAEAARFYQAALDLWAIDSDQSGRAELLARLGYCLWVIDNTQGSLKCYETAYILFDQLGNRSQSGEMQRMIGRMYWEHANRALALEHYNKALAILEQGPESVELARAIDSIAQIMMLTHDNKQGIIWGERAIKMAEALGAESVVVGVLNNIGSSYAQMGEYEKGLSILHESIQRAIVAGLPQDVSRGYYNAAVVYQRQCRYNKADEAMKELYAYSLKFYTKSYSIVALWRLTWINWLTGQWNAALNYRAQMVESSGTLYVTWAKRIFGMIDLDLGMANEALRELEDSLPNAVRADEFQTTVPHWAQMARAYAAVGQDAKMMDVIHQLLEFVTTRNYQSNESIMPLLIACQLTAAQGSVTSLEISHTCVFHLERLAQQYQTAETDAALAEARGCVLLAEEHTLESVEQFRQAVSKWETIERRFDQARALAYLGRSLKILRDTAGSLTAYHQAREITASLFNQLDPDQRSSFLASSLVNEINTAIEALSHAAPRRNSKREAHQLTDREAEILKLVAQGLTNAQIAESLYLSPLTVNAHLRSIFNKLDVMTRTAAVRHATELGLI
jgi:DNA-binding CsgD family transcriptional regulator